MEASGDNPQPQLPRAYELLLMRVEAVEAENKALRATARSSDLQIKWIRAELDDTKEDLDATKAQLKATKKALKEFTSAAGAVFMFEKEK